MSAIVELEPVSTDLAGKYLTFRLGEEVYGIEILRIQEIIGLLPITRIPHLSDHIRGVINLRGKVIPIMDLARRFGMPDQEDTPLTCIIVAELVRGGSAVTMGIVVDEVSEVIDISAESIEGPPDLGSSVNCNFLSGMGKVGEIVVILLDVTKVLEPSAGAALELQDNL